MKRDYAACFDSLQRASTTLLATNDATRVARERAAAAYALLEDQNRELQDEIDALRAQVDDLSDVNARLERVSVGETLPARLYSRLGRRRDPDADDEEALAVGEGEPW
jgi:hypothetical protein